MIKKRLIAPELPSMMGPAIPAEEVGYARVSDPSQDPSMQIALLKKRGIPEANIFVDHGKSGRRMDRPQLRLALKLMRPGWTLVVWKLDRLGRNALGLMELAQEFIKDDMNLVSMTEQIDTRTPFGRFYFGLLAHLAQLESDMTQERTRAGMGRLKDEGFKLGRPNKVDDAMKKAIERDLRNPKLSKKDIAKRHKIGVSTIDLHFPGYRTKLMHKAKHK